MSEKEKEKEKEKKKEQENVKQPFSGPAEPKHPDAHLHRRDPLQLLPR
jgi:hypothetical protein